MSMDGGDGAEALAAWTEAMVALVKVSSCTNKSSFPNNDLRRLTSKQLCRRQKSNKYKK